jgi:WD40 repeat protein
MATLLASPPTLKRFGETAARLIRRDPTWPARAVPSKSSAAPASGDGRTRVFISYSRKDSAFAVWLRQALSERGIEVFQDIADTLPGEEWWHRLQQLIGEADTVIFVLSPNSVASKVCKDEVAYALNLSKRVFPAIITDINWALAPEGLIKIHALSFDRIEQREEALGHLVQALETDIGWIREHTRLGGLALHWDVHQRPRGDLLRGRALEEAEHWLTQRPKTARSPTNLHQEYIRASRSAARERGRLLIAGSVAFAIAMSGIGAYAWLQKVNAQTQSQSLLREKSHMLTEFANQSRRDGDPVTGGLLAVEALPEFDGKSERPYYPSAEFALHAALHERRERLVLGGTHIVRKALFSGDDRQVLTAENDGRVRIRDAASGKPVGQLGPKRNRGARTLSYSADRRRIIVGYDDSVVRVIEARTRIPLFELTAPARSIRVAVFSPDGSRILTAGENNSTIWDTATHSPKFTVTGPGLTVDQAGFSADGNKILTVSNGTAAIWDANSGEEIATLPGTALYAVFSPEGQQILTANEDGKARLWDIAGRLVDVLSGHDGPVLFADFSGDGRHIITGSGDNTARLWNTAPLAVAHMLLGHSAGVKQGAFSADGKRVLTISDDLTVRVWDVDTGIGIAVLKGHQEWITSAAFSGNGKTVLTGSEDATARLWDIEPMRSHTPLGGPDESAVFAVFSNDGKHLATTYEDGTVRIWNGETGQPARVTALGPVISEAEGAKAHSDRVVSAAFNHDGSKLATGSLDGTARVWDLESGKQVAELVPDGNRAAVNSVAFSPDGQFVLTATKSGTASLWEGEKRVPLPGGDGSELFSAAFSQDGARVAAASANGTAQIWDVRSGKLSHVLKAHTGACRAAVFTADGRRILTAGDTTVRFWDSDTWELIKVFDKAHRPVIDAKVDHDQSSIVALFHGRPFVYLWNIHTGTAAELSGAAAGSPDDGAHTEQVTSVAISPDGRRIATASNDGTARIWDAQTGAPIDMLRYSNNPKALTYAAIRHDGQRIATTSRDGTAQLWPVAVSPREAVDAAEREVPRCLTDVQRQKFGLAPAPPPWCIELEKWPYQLQAWKFWLKYKQAGLDPPLPTSPGWDQWLAEHNQVPLRDGG